MSVDPKDIRNVAVVGHNGTGKTSLVESMLYYTGAIPKAEAVAGGKTTSDFTEEEIARKISVHTALASTEWMGKRINILDTPGTADFIGEAICSFRSAEAALMLVDARDGAQIETIKLWIRLDTRNKPRAVFINKMDKERANSRDVLDNLTEEFHSNFAPVTIPIGYAEEFKGVINLIENQAYKFNPNGKEEIIPIPADMAETVEKYREELIEKYVKKDDDGKPLTENGFYVFKDRTGWDKSITELLETKAEVSITQVPERVLIKCDNPEFDSLTVPELLAIGFMII